MSTNNFLEDKFLETQNLTSMAQRIKPKSVNSMLDVFIEQKNTD